MLAERPARPLHHFEHPCIRQQFRSSWRSRSAATCHHFGRALRRLCLDFDESYGHAERGVQQIYLRDTCAQPAPSGCAPVTTIVSVDSSGNALAGSSQLPAISDDGRFIVLTPKYRLQEAAPPTMSSSVTLAIHRAARC